MSQGFLHKLDIKSAQEYLVSSLTKILDIVFTRSYWRIIVGPAWVHVQTEDGAISSLLLISDGGKHLLEIIETRFDVGFRIIRLPLLPSPTVEVAVWRIHYAMQDNNLTIGIHQVLTLHTECRQIICSQPRH